MGKYVDKRLEELGATRVVEAGVGDDDGKWVEITDLNNTFFMIQHVLNQ